MAEASAPRRLVPVARHGRLRKGSAVGTILRFLAIAVCVVLVAAGSVVAIALNDVATKITKSAVNLGDAATDIPTIGAYSGAVNLLLVGSDTRNGQKGHYGSNPGSSLNDVTILLHISKDHTKATIISFPRDTYVDVPDTCKSNGQSLPAEYGVKLNSTLSYGGLACVRNTVASMTGMKIPYVALITFDGVVQMSNAVGGVPVCVATAINDDYTGLHLSKGEHTLKGVTALKFLRTRHGVGDGSDLTRITSQQVFLSSLVRVIKSNATLTDITKLYGLAEAAADSMTLSTSLANVDTMVSIAKALAPIDLNKVVFVQFPTTISGDGVVVNTESATALLDAVKSDKTIKLHKNSGENAGGSVVESSSSATASATASASAKSTKSATATPSASASEETVTLPSGVTGQTAAQQSCSVGNDLGTR